MANKKINQLVAKTTIQSTDLFPLGDASTGQLFKKTIAELQAAIGGAVISVNGLVGTVVLDTDDIQELATPTNKYFTDARARGAISLTVTGNSGASTYSNSTGVLNVPTYTLAGLGGITASFLSGGTGITYNSTTGVIAYSGTVYTDASIRALFSAGAGLSYNSSTGVFSYSGTVYTDASIRALISLTTTGNSGVSSYNNTTGVLNVPNYTLAGLGGISLTSLSGTAPITYNSSTGAIGITQANTSTNGFLSSTDWNTFNGKQNALTLGNVTEVASNVLMFPDGGTNKTIGNLSIQVVQSGASTNGYLSSTDWTTFNNKQATVTLTTTGTSGAATFSAGTLNIPQYAGAFSGTTNYITKFTSSSAIGISQIFDNGTSVGIGTNTPSGKFNIVNNGTTLFSNQVFSNSSSTASLAMGIAGSAVVATFLQNNAYIINSGNSSLIFGTNDTERIRISASGQLGIGTSSPANTLDVQTSSGVGSSSATGLARFITAGTTTAISIGQANSARRLDIRTENIKVTGDQFSIQTADAQPILFETNGSIERMRITADRNIGINDTSPNQLMCISNYSGYSSYFKAKRTTSAVEAGIILEDSANSTTWLMYRPANNTQLRFYNGNGDQAAITYGGNFLMGTTTDNGERLYVSGSIRATGSITANSDVRLKKNIERIENALQKVSEISGYTYNTIYDEDRHAGVIAQEIDKVLPEIVNKGNDGLMGVEYGNISALLIEAIKEQKVLIESLQAKVEALEK
jgi:hypothetical protein